MTNDTNANKAEANDSAQNLLGKLKQIKMKDVFNNLSIDQHINFSANVEKSLFGGRKELRLRIVDVF